MQYGFGTLEFLLLLVRHRRTQQERIDLIQADGLLLTTLLYLSVSNEKQSQAVPRIVDAARRLQDDVIASMRWGGRVEQVEEKPAVTDEDRVTYTQLLADGERFSSFAQLTAKIGALRDSLQEVQKAIPQKKVPDA